MAIQLHNIEWEKGISGPKDYEISDIDELNEYTDGDFSNYDLIMDYAGEKNHGNIISCEMTAEVCIPFSSALYDGLFGKGSEAVMAVIGNKDLRDLIDSYHYNHVVIEAPLEMLLDYYEEKLASDDRGFTDWYFDEYSEDDTRDLLEYLKEHNIEISNIRHDGQELFDFFQRKIEPMNYEENFEEREI